MNKSHSSIGPFEYLLRSWHIAWKDLRIYYSSPATIMMGLLFPMLMFLTFWLGKGLSIAQALPGLASLAVFFGSSSIAVTTLALERAKNTFDTQLSMPVPLLFIIIGKTTASCLYGFAISVIPVTFLAVLTRVSINYPLLVLSLACSSLCSSGLGMLLSATAKRVPQAMTPLNSIRIPMMFISGVFLPLDLLPWYLRGASYLAPLTYVVSSLRYAILHEGSCSSYFAYLGALLLFASLFLLDASRRLGNTLK